MKIISIVPYTYGEDEATASLQVNGKIRFEVNDTYHDIYFMAITNDEYQGSWEILWTDERMLGGMIIFENGFKLTEKYLKELEKGVLDNVNKLCPQVVKFNEEVNGCQNGKGGITVGQFIAMKIKTVSTAFVEKVLSLRIVLTNIS